MINLERHPHTPSQPAQPKAGQRGHAVPVEAIEHCRLITKQHSSTFYLGSLFFPRQQRHAVWAVYGACRTGDDIVDELDPHTARTELEAWRERTQTALAGQAQVDPVADALGWASTQFPLRYAPYEELYLGLRMDLEQNRYETLEELLLYCRRVAGVVGWMIAPISGFSGGNDTLERALRMGMAMQLTNILRDVGEDLERDRIYLPREMMRQHGVTEDDLRARRITPGYVALMRDLERLAREMYRDGWRGLARLHGPAGFAVAVAAASYEGILAKLEMNGWDNFTRRAFVPGREKLAMIPRVWWTLRSAASSSS
jgi:phytoene synthase